MFTVTAGALSGVCLVAAPAGATTPPDSGADGPIVIGHRFGTTELDAIPERIVTLDLQWTDALLAVGIEPVGYVTLLPEGVFPWQEGRLGDAEAIPFTDSIPLEQVAALDPDLILGGYETAQQERFEQLAAIAPTIGMLGDKEVDDWRDQLAVVAEVTGRADEAAAAEAVVDGVVDTAATDLPGLDGHTYALVNYLAGEGGFYVVADPEDGSSELFYGLGMQIEPGIIDVADGGVGRAEMSLEQIGLLSADLLIFYAETGDVTQLPGYDVLPAVESGAVVTLDFASVVGLNTPTPLSIPYSLGIVMPLLEIVATG